MDKLLIELRQIIRDYGHNPKWLHPEWELLLNQAIYESEVGCGTKKKILEFRKLLSNIRKKARRVNTWNNNIKLSKCGKWIKIVGKTNKERFISQYYEIEGK